MFLGSCGPPFNGGLDPCTSWLRPHVKFGGTNNTQVDRVKVLDKHIIPTEYGVRVQHICTIVERMQKDPSRIDTAADKGPYMWGIKSNVEYSKVIPRPFYTTVPETMHFGQGRSIITWRPREFGRNRVFHTCGKLWSVDCSMLLRYFFDQIICNYLGIFQIVTPRNGNETETWEVRSVFKWHRVPQREGCKV